MIIDKPYKNKWKLNEPIDDKRIKISIIHRSINNIIVTFPTNTNHETDSDMIIPGLWLGNIRSVTDKNFIKNANIKSIIGILSQSYPETDVRDYTQYNIKDIEACYANLLKFMMDGIDIIHQNISCGNNVLVHCKKGHHRSASLVAFYLVKYKGMSLPQAIYFIKIRRPTTFQRISCMLKTIIEHQCTK